MKLSVPKVLFPALALLLVAWWLFGRETTTPLPAVRQDVPAGVGQGPSNVSLVTHPVGQVPGYTAPPIESMTPGEVAALREAEVERSAKSEPPRTFVGIDGKQHVLQYNGSAKSRAIDDAREVRRTLLMKQLMADPQRFARDNRLTLKEVQWILDGDSDFPDRMLD